MVCFVLRPGPPPTGLKPPLINYTSTSTTVATTPLDFADNDPLLSDNAMYDEMMAAGGGPTEIELPSAVTAEVPTSTETVTVPTYDGNSTTLIYDGGVNSTTLIYDDGGGGMVVKLHGKSSGSDRSRHRNTWSQANRTTNTNYTSHKVRTRYVIFFFGGGVIFTASLKSFLHTSPLRLSIVDFFFYDETLEN